MAGKYAKKNDSNKRKPLLILCIVLAAILVVLLALYIGVNVYLTNNISRFDNAQTYASDPTATVADPTDTVPVVEQAESIMTDGVVNILLVGQDRREGQGRMHSDAMILCTINKKTKTVTMTSFMRDMWVYIPDRFNERINVPYMLGGFELLNATLDYNFGVCADYNVEIDFEGFMSAIDLLGGVEIELTAAEARYLNRRGNWEVDDNVNWNLVEGANLLTGSQALAYSRIRDIGDDFERTNRQRTVLTKLLEKAKTLSSAEIFKLIDGILPMLTTDMTNNQIMGLAIEMIPLLSDLQIVSQRIPMDGEYRFANKGGASVIELTEEHFKKNKELLSEAMKTKN